MQILVVPSSQACLDPDIAHISWEPQDPNVVGTLVGSGSTLTFNLTDGAGGGGGIQPTFLAYTGVSPACCNLHVVITAAAANGNPFIEINVYSGAHPFDPPFDPAIVGTGTLNVVGVYDFPFTIPSSATPRSCAISVGVGGSPGFLVGFATFSNVN